MACRDLRRAGSTLRALLIAAATAWTVFFPATDAGADPAEPTTRWHLDRDAGLVLEGHDVRLTTWWFGQGVVATNHGGPYARRVRQGMEVDLPHLGPLRPLAIYELDFTDNDFFQVKPASKLFENAFVGVQADDPDVFRLIYGENTHILSREDNLSSGNLPTINRSIILESQGSVHGFGTQWGGQIRFHPLSPVLVQASMGDNRGSLNQDKPRFGAINDFSAKTIVTVWKNARLDLTIGLTGDYTRHIEPGMFTMGSAISNSPLLAAPVFGDRLTGEADATLTAKTSWPFLLEAEWIVSAFGSGSRAMGGYLQGTTRLYASERLGDLAFVLRPEVALLHGPDTHTGSVVALRTALDWNLPWFDQRLNALLEAASHATDGPANLRQRAQPGFEIGLMLRVSLTRHLRFAE